MGFDEGARLTRVAGGPVSYYNKYTTTTLFVAQNFGGGVNSITISNDSLTDTVVASYDGATVETELSPGESITLNAATRNSVYIRGTAGGDSIRIWAW